MQTKCSVYHVLMVAAGKGTRAGGNTPKQYREVAGKTLLRRSVDNVLSWPGIEALHVVIAADDAKAYHDAVSGLDLPDFIAGSKSRKGSVYNGLKALSHLKDDDIILIHDCARMFAHRDDIAALMQTMQTARAATLAVPVADTLRHSDNTPVDRDGLWAIQTPQAFRYGDIIKAHEKTAGQDATDDTALLSALGVDVEFVHSKHTNFKITTQSDLTMAEALISQQTFFRTGSGFDVHAFEDAPSGRKLMLCGIEIEHDRGLAGHSDADVGLHAITDALLGAIGGGDIGDHFPPSDPAFKDKDSAEFLKAALDMTTNAEAEIQNVDITLICEAPKIGPHKEAMRERIANILALPASAINVKATTTEGLGFTGRGEGIAAQASVTVRVSAS